MFEKLKARWRENHPMNPYDAEEAALHEALARLDPGTDEYGKAQDQLGKINSMRKEHWESKKRMTIGDRGKLLLKILGGGITIGGVCLLSKYEADGHMFTGEKKSFADGFVRTLGRFFGGGD